MARMSTGARPRPPYEELLAHASCVVWRKLAQYRKHRVPVREDALTSELLLTLAKGAPSGDRLTLFDTSNIEGKFGADFEIWVRLGERQWRGYVVQAKKVEPDDPQKRAVVRRFGHRVGGRYQMEVLLEHAREVNALAVHALYCGWPGTKYPRHPGTEHMPASMMDEWGYFPEDPHFEDAREAFASGIGILGVSTAAVHGACMGKLAGKFKARLELLDRITDKATTLTAHWDGESIMCNFPEGYEEGAEAARLRARYATSIDAWDQDQKTRKPLVALVRDAEHSSAHKREDSAKEMIRLRDTAANALQSFLDMKYVREYLPELADEVAELQRSLIMDPGVIYLDELRAAKALWRFEKLIEKTGPLAPARPEPHVGSYPGTLGLTHWDEETPGEGEAPWYVQTLQALYREPRVYSSPPPVAVLEREEPEQREKPATQRKRRPRTHTVDQETFLDFLGLASTLGTIRGTDLEDISDLAEAFPRQILIIDAQD